MTHLTPELREKIVKTLINKMNEFYILPDKATEFDAYAHKKLEAGQYDIHEEVNNFASELTADLQLIVGDRHLGVNYAPEMYEQVLKWEQNPDAHEPDGEAEKKWIEEAHYYNNGFQRIERLTGNVGYIQLNGFHEASYAGDTAVAAMNSIAYCDALIFDLRQNGGGSPSMIQLLSSYLFNKRTHLNNFYDRHDDKTTQFWTQDYIQGKKMPDIPVYVLTSNRTFSAAEEFTYNLKNLKRATIVGETTGGGGHPVMGMTLADGFVARICRARAVNPITNNNWEGVGVAPDVAVPQSEALAKAHILALETLHENSTSDVETAKRQWELDTVRVMYYPVDITADELRKFNGRFGGFVIQAENSHLVYTRRGFPGKLTAITKNRFVDLAEDNTHLEFVSDDNGGLSLKIIFRDDARTMTFPRSEAD